jgi:hypothetical protein
MIPDGENRCVEDDQKIEQNWNPFECEIHEVFDQSQMESQGVKTEEDESRSRSNPTNMNDYEDDSRILW